MKKNLLLPASLGMTLFVISMALLQCSTKEKVREAPDKSGNPDAWSSSIKENAEDMLEKGKAVFRFETFGDEVFWTDKLHKI